MFKKKKQYEWTAGRVGQLGEECYQWLGRKWKKKVAVRVSRSHQTISNAFNWKNGKPFSRDCSGIYSACIKMIDEERQRISKEIKNHFNE
jgi:hypothetical protein